MTKPKYLARAKPTPTIKARKGSIRPTRINLAWNSSQNSISRTNWSNSKTIATPDKPQTF